jgi:hypothetical protein
MTVGPCKFALGGRSIEATITYFDLQAAVPDSTSLQTTATSRVWESPALASCFGRCRKPWGEFQAEQEHKELRGLGGAERGQQDNRELTFSTFYYYRWAPDLAGATVALAFRGMVDVTT